MDKRGKLRIAAGVVLTTAAVFALLSLASHSTFDPGGGDYSTDARVRNWCGIVGARFSGFLITYFGSAAAAFTVGLAVFWSYLLLIARQPLSDAYLKILGSLVLVATISALSALAGAGDHFTSTVGSTLAVGAGRYFGLLGAYIVLFLASVLSLLLATDFLVVSPAGHFLLSVVAFLRAAVSKLFVLAFKRKKRTPAPAAKPRPSKRETEPEPEPEPELFPESSPAPALPSVQRAVSRAEAAPPAKPARQAHEESADGYLFPPVDLLDDAESDEVIVGDQYVHDKAQILKDTLAEFGVNVEVVGIETGPVITQYEIALAPGIKVTRVVSLTDDIAMALKAPSVRIVAPIPGRDSIGIEVPNTRKATVNLRALLNETTTFKTGMIPFYMGRDARGDPLVADLTEMPHLLIAGTTGSGKSVCINSLVLSILMKKQPDDVKLLLVDPKMVELAAFHNLPHLICPVVTDMKKAAAILEWACITMDARYDYLASVNVRHISRYNKLGPDGIRDHLKIPRDSQIELPDKIPYIVIIIDELADLMMLAAKDIETSITRLAQKSRAVGIHLVLATQRPSVDVITGLIKSNLPARLSFQVSSRIDSRTILDQNGADKLLGRGDMLFLPPATAKLVRAQGTFVSDDEIHRVTDFVKNQGRPDYDDDLADWKTESSSTVISAPAFESSAGSQDPLYSEAVQVAIEHQRGSVSLLQRRLEIGYGRAARLIDFMAEDGILGPYNGSQARDVLFTIEQWEEMQKELKAKNRS